MESMNIESAHYDADIMSGINCSITAVIEGVITVVPLDPANGHYAEILRQVEAGTLIIQPADEG